MLAYMYACHELHMQAVGYTAFTYIHVHMCYVGSINLRI